jgi:hypothetical protein
MVDKKTRQKLVVAIRDRYCAATKLEKQRILDEFVALTGYHRKHAIRVLVGDADVTMSSVRSRPRVYDEAARQVIIIAWEASDRICGKRLKPLLPVLIAALERHGHMKLDPTVGASVLEMSAATIDRVLAEQRAVTRGKKRTRPKLTVRANVPVRTFADWKDPAPGFVEADLVSHCGGTATGSFAYTLVLTDIASGWTECVALLVREASVVVEAFERLRNAMPFPLRGIDTDNGSEFVNETLIAYCVLHKIEFTRSRPWLKNDQAWVEQKNGSIVRRIVGYGRLEGLRGCEALARLYCASRLFVNFFQPSFKLAEKHRTGARVTKRYQAPETPCARLLALASIDTSAKERLRAVLLTLDPLRLLDEIRSVQQHIVKLGAGDAEHLLPHRNADLDRFLKSLAVAWKDGEVRPTHRKSPAPERYWRTRADPFESVWPLVITWLEAEPDRTGKELFERLQGQYPNVFPIGQLRTLQRRIKTWRRAAARRLVFTEPNAALGAQV